LRKGAPEGCTEEYEGGARTRFHDASAIDR
jgi:hypothetical protein